MERVCVCKSCGRTIDREYIYCPWCGNARLSVFERDSMDAVVSMLVQSQNDGREKQVSVLRDRLDELDRELSVFSLSVEMHR